jgi:hypothetical protein
MLLSRWLINKKGLFFLSFFLLLGPDFSSIGHDHHDNDIATGLHYNDWDNEEEQVTLSQDNDIAKG